jgi:cytochrome c biogenesis protein CcmG, thiol:disulfide interchange protein DsbE
MNKRLQLFVMLVPIPIFITVLFFLWRGLALKPEILPSALLGKPVPAFHLTNILAPSYPFTEQSLKGQVTLVNVWASWCYACEMEHPMLMEIKNRYHIPIYGIDYKDDPVKTKTFLSELGNPYTVLGNDSTGDVAMDFGVYGTPETFIVDKQGMIIYRHVGVINRQVWEDELLPVIKRSL